MTWRLAKSLELLRKQVNETVPGRSRKSDGTIGNAEHATRTSDHNPWVREGKMGVVTAVDITHDPHGGFDSYEFAEHLRQKRDLRIKYVISDGKIFSSPVVSGKTPWQWREYTGSNPHDHHVHISVRSDKKFYDDTKPWDIGTMAPPLPRPRPTWSELPTLLVKSTGKDVEKLQQLLAGAGFPPEGGADGFFGKNTEDAVKAFQKAKGLVADGVVGTYTWKALGSVIT